MRKKIKQKLVNPDGKLNGKIISGMVALILVLISQICAIFGYDFHGLEGHISDVAYTIFTLLGLVGVMSDTSTIKHEEGDVSND